MIAEFTVKSRTVDADGVMQVRLQPIGEPGFRLVEIHEPEEDGVLGDLTIEFDDGTRYVPKPGRTVRFKLTKDTPRE